LVVVWYLKILSSRMSVPVLGAVPAVVTTCRIYAGIKMSHVFFRVTALMARIRKESQRMGPHAGRVGDQECRHADQGQQTRRFAGHTQTLCRERGSVRANNLGERDSLS